MSDVGDLALIIRSRIPLIIIESHDERRVLAMLAEIGISQGMAIFEWTAVRGLETGGVQRKGLITEPKTTDPVELLREVSRSPGPALYALCDFHPYFRDAPEVVRWVKEVALDFERLHNTIVFVAHEMTLPPELSRLSASFRMALPSDEQLLGIVREQAMEWGRVNGQRKVRTDQHTLNRLVANLRGVTEADARTLIRHAIFTDGAISESDLPEVNRLKFDLLNAEGVLHFEYDTSSLNDVAGLDNLKRWLNERRALVAGSTEGDLDRPRGLMLLGVQGGGKSLAARSIAGEFGIPLLRLDFGTLFNKFVGETERNLRNSLLQAERMSPCVLWMDEIEKGIDTRGSDNATARRLLGTLLTWLAENKAPVFIVATANDIRALPPELMRKGRLDEIFFVDLPNPAARRDILRIHVSRRGGDPDQLDLGALANCSDGFTGAELEQAVVSARYRAAADARGLDTALIMDAIGETVPLSVTMAEDMAALRAWAADRCVPAD